MTGAALTASYPPPPRRTEYMMSVHPVKSTRCLGNEINSDLNWNVHVKEFISPFQKIESS